LNGSIFFENLTKPAGHLDVCPGVVQCGHPGEEDVQPECIDRSQSIRVDGHFAGLLDAFVQNVDQFARRSRIKIAEQLKRHALISDFLDTNTKI